MNKNKKIEQIRKEMVRVGEEYKKAADDWKNHGGSYERTQTIFNHYKELNEELTQLLYGNV